MTVGELRKIIKDLPDDINIFTTDYDCCLYSLDFDEVSNNELYLNSNRIL